ncbi:MAG TPA: prephenate dehydrogenase/arogenate dehydrogenase family protein [Armatimonadetes bacterium]|nr:prephenate dehydrogenase/arogenate dehydrogenase family protein [Armatimonadota bacterium]
MAQVLFNRVAIIGVGLIGGSFGLALKKRGLCREIVGFARTSRTLQAALARGAIDQTAESAEASAEGADLVYLATPVGAIVSLLERLGPHLSPGTIVSDAGSVKGVIVRRAQTLAWPEAHFLGGHPMAGNEQAGIAAADPDLFAGAAYVLTPTEDTPAEVVARMQALVEGLGSRCYLLSPEVHDRTVAAISHLPHLIAATLMHLAERRAVTGEPAWELAAGSFDSATRVARSNPALWLDICFGNREEVLRAVAEFQEILRDLTEALRTENQAQFEQFFVAAQALREAHGRPSPVSRSRNS